MGGYTISFSKLLVLIGTTISQLESAPVLLSGGVSQIKSPSGSTGNHSYRPAGL